jgi:exosortase A-associated hydrolase 2
MKKTFSLEPAYIDGSKGSLFALHFRPLTQNDASECFVIVSSFAEEMNRCRYMQNLLAQALTEQGYSLLIVDPYGTGDSAGEFADADWQQWVRDILTAADYAEKLGYENVSLLAIRLGALLATAAATQINNLKRIVFWQPVVSGKTTLNQFLRLKIAASINRDEDAGTTAQLENEIREGKSIQVAGYDMSPGLFEGIHAADLESAFHLTDIPIAWFTILASSERKTPRSDIKSIESWRSNGADIQHFNIIGPAFWQAHERTLAPDLIPATLGYILAEHTQ